MVIVTLPPVFILPIKVISLHFSLHFIPCLQSAVHSLHFTVTDLNTVGVYYEECLTMSHDQSKNVLTQTLTVERNYSQLKDSFFSSENSSFISFISTPSNVLWHFAQKSYIQTIVFLNEV